MNGEYSRIAVAISNDARTGMVTTAVKLRALVEGVNQPNPTQPNFFLSFFCSRCGARSSADASGRFEKVLLPYIFFVVVLHDVEFRNSHIARNFYCL